VWHYNEIVEMCKTLTRTIEKRQLEQVKDHQKREECVQVNIKAECPLNILTSRWLQYQVMVRQIPVTGHNMPGLRSLEYQTM